MANPVDLVLQGKCTRHPAHKDHLAHQAPMDSQVVPANQDRMDIRESLDTKAHQEMLEVQVHQASPVEMAIREATETPEDTVSATTALHLALPQVTRRGDADTVPHSFKPVTLFRRELVSHYTHMHTVSSLDGRSKDRSASFMSE